MLRLQPMSDHDAGPVLVATDLTEQSDEALRQADAWARRHQRALVVCHALPDQLGYHPLFPHLGVDAIGQLHKLRAEAADTIAERVEQRTDRAPDEFAVALSSGSPSTVILREAERREASIIVLASTSKGEAAKLLLGTTADQVVRHASVPVLVTRSTPISGLVLAGSDLSDATLPAIEAAVAEAKTRRAALVAVHSLDISHPALSAFNSPVNVDRSTLASVREACKQTLEAALQRFDAGSIATAEVLDGPPARTLARRAEQGGADLIVVATHSRTTLRRLALGSVAARVVRRAWCSVLVIRSSQQ